MSKSLVVYFSCTGVTKKVAQNLSEAIDADLFEIVPKQLYTVDDLDWNDKESRSTIEMKDISSRPEIRYKMDIDNYDIIYIGFPIWWYIAPTIINTFLEQYNLSNKTVVAFATSGGSKMGGTLEALKPSVSPSAHLIEGKIINPYDSKESLKEWAKSLQN